MSNYATFFSSTDTADAKASPAISESEKVKNKKVFLTLGVIFGLALLAMITGALSLGAINAKEAAVQQVSSQQLMENNSLIIADLVARVRFLEHSLQQSQVQQH